MVTMKKIISSNPIGINIFIIVIIISISFIYFSPQIEGKILEQSDITHFKGMSKELADYRSDNGEEAIWTNGMFGGMPGYMISVLYPSNLAQPTRFLPDCFIRPQP